MAAYKNQEKKLYLPLLAIIVFYTIGPFLYLLRVLVGDTGITSALLRLMQPSLLLLVFFSYLVQANKKISLFNIIFMILGGFGISVSFLHDNNIYDIFAGASHFFFGCVLFLYFYQVNIEPVFDKFMRVLTLATLASISVVIVIMYALPVFLGINIYLGLACQILVAVFFYNFHHKKWFYTLLSIVLIILSGKRGVLVALLLGIVVSFIPYFLKYHHRGTIKALIFLVIFAVITISFNPKSVERVVEKFTYTSNTDINDYSSGRLNEAKSAYLDWTSDSNKVNWGSGFGFTYQIDTEKGVINTDKYKNVHFSYLNPLIIFGVYFSIVYYLTLFLLLGKILIRKNSEFRYIKWICITYFIYAVFVFNLFNEVILWLLIGMELRRPKLEHRIANE